MADTMQGVTWALEQACKLRSGEAVCDPDQASAAVGLADCFGESLARPPAHFGIFGEVLITGLNGATLPERLLPQPPSLMKRLFHSGGPKDPPCAHYPSRGYVISEMFGAVGGAEGLKQMCAACPANFRKPYPAGCTGFFSEEPWSKEVQAHMQAIILRRGLSAAMAERFTATTPIWFGLWTRSPLTREAAVLLLQLLGELDRELAGTWRWSVDSRRDFLAALSIAAEGNVRLHVKMSPPGHTDFGYYTIFPHCPQCKAEADLPRWKGEYPAEMIDCQVCGMRYSPREQSSRQSDNDRDATELRESLGTERFLALAHAYLVARGHTPADAAEIVKLTEAEKAENRK